jgi:hypothetical protein
MRITYEATNGHEIRYELHTTRGPPPQNCTLFFATINNANMVTMSNSEVGTTLNMII